MFADWPIARRIAASTVVALSVGVLLATLFDGLSPSYPVRLGQVIAWSQALAPLRQAA